MSGRGHQIVYAAVELAWIKAHRAMARRAAHALFCTTFRRPDITLDNIKALCTREGWKTGRTGCFPKGHVPENKGKQQPYNANSARTQFQKGGRTGRANQVYKPIGTERVTVDGYIERKIHNGLPMQSRWRAVPLLNWEALHGPLPKHHCLKCLSDNRANADPANWQLIHRALLQQLNHHARTLDYDDAPPELKPVMLTLAKLKVLRHAKTKKEQS